MQTNSTPALGKENAQKLLSHGASSSSNNTSEGREGVWLETGRMYNSFLLLPFCPYCIQSTPISVHACVCVCAVHLNRFADACCSAMVAAATDYVYRSHNQTTDAYKFLEKKRFVCVCVWENERITCVPWPPWQKQMKIGNQFGENTSSISIFSNNLLHQLHISKKKKKKKKDVSCLWWKLQLQEQEIFSHVLKSDWSDFADITFLFCYGEKNACTAESRRK